MNARHTDDPAAAEHRTALLVFLFIAAGLAALALFAAVLSGTGTLPLRTGSPIDAGLVLWIWIALAVSAGLTVVSLWRARVDPLLASQAMDDAAPAGREGHARRLLTALVSCWALLEAPALLAVVLFILGGDRLLFGLGVAFALVGLGATAPRRQWFRSGGSS